MSYHSTRLTSPPPSLCSPLCPTIHHVPLPFRLNCVLRYVPTFITSHCLSTSIGLSIMSQLTTRLTVPPPRVCSPLCPTIHPLTLPPQKHCALRYAPQFIRSHCSYKNSALHYVPSFITSHCPSTKTVISVMPHQSSRLTAPPKKVLSVMSHN